MAVWLDCCNNIDDYFLSKSKKWKSERIILLNFKLTCYNLQRQIGFVNKRSYLYTSPNSISKMYLIKGDQVIINDVRSLRDEKWYLINYKGKKEINMWIKADSVDLD